jgi:hypothetical protein
MISHAAWHLVLLLSLQICAGTWTETTNCKFCPCPQQILLFQYMVRDIPYNIIAADQYRCATSSEFYLPLESLLKPNEFERNLAVPLALIGSNKGPHRDVSVPSSTGEFDLHLHRGTRWFDLVSPAFRVTRIQKKSIQTGSFRLQRHTARPFSQKLTLARSTS